LPRPVTVEFDVDASYDQGPQALEAYSTGEPAKRRDM
jgi:hypothetical protein